MSKKIALFLPSLYSGGAERVMLNLAKGFADAGHQVIKAIKGDVEIESDMNKHLCSA